MTEMTVNCTKSYKVIIDKGVLGRCAEMIVSAVPAKKYCLISDGNVAPLYASETERALRQSGAEVCTYVFEPGEASKTLSTVGAILDLLASHRFTRADCLIALGGGITGDITGFAASIYMRGIRFVQLPTTLLAAVDSSVGGKTGVNLDGLKNQVGSFWQPSLVLCDPSTFDTLPRYEFENGLAEVIKYAAICAPDIAERLDGDICELISRCVSIKSDIVSRDETDRTERMLLNYGHTFGHAIEKVSGETVPHGRAVAIGMVIAARLAEKLGACETGVAAHTADLLLSRGLPISADGFTSDQLFEAIKNDKKRNSDEITLVLPRRFGSCFLRTVTMDELHELMN